MEDAGTQGEASANLGGGEKDLPLGLNPLGDLLVQSVERLLAAAKLFRHAAKVHDGEDRLQEQFQSRLFGDPLGEAPGEAIVALNLLANPLASGRKESRP